MEIVGAKGHISEDRETGTIEHEPMHGAMHGRAAAVVGFGDDKDGTTRRIQLPGCPL
jgi:hypothetical protein